jgi:hypothetical protein
MAINLKSNPDGISGALQVNGVDVVPFNGSGISSGVVTSVNGMAGVVTLQTTLPVVIVSGTSQTATNGNHYVLTNVAATTVTLPATPSAGDTVWVTVDNSLLTNIIAKNGSTIMGLSEDLTINKINLTVELRYINNTWRLV